MTTTSRSRLNFNASNAEDGADWERAALVLLRSHGWRAVAGRAVDGRKVTINGVDIDLVMTDPQGVEHTIEAKGTLSGATRPGAQRSDTVKKAIADAWYLKVTGSRRPHLLYASHLPECGIAFDQLCAAIDHGLFTAAMSPDHTIEGGRQ